MVSGAVVAEVVEAQPRAVCLPMVASADANVSSECYSEWASPVTT